VAIASVAIGLGATVPFGGSWVDALFVGGIAAAALIGGRAALRAILAADEARRDAAALSATPDSMLVIAALEHERARLADDIDATLRASLARIATLSDEPADPLGAVRAVHAAARQASSELRRRLGLLRGAGGSEVEGPRPSSTAVSPWTDVAIGAAVALLAFAEAIAYPLIEGWDRGPVAVALTVLAAASVTVWRLAPAAGAAICAACYLVAVLLGTSVTSGFWTVAVIGLLVGRLCAIGRTWRDALGVTALAAAIPIATLRSDPDNAAMTVAFVVAAAVVGGIIRLARGRARTARRRAAQRREEVRPLVHDALTSERRSIARELHDTMSHAVGVIAMQAAAGDVSWLRDPERTRDCIRVIHQTALAAIDELGAPAEPAAAGDLAALIERIRLTGTHVRFTSSLVAPPGLEGLTYRIAQEALTNALRHAPGSVIDVDLRVVDGMLRLVVEDDGAGPGGETHRGYGLVGVAERVAIAGGRLVTGTRPGGRGFRLDVTVPLQRVVPS
jgi:signal transduction histidine kinase